MSGPGAIGNRPVNTGNTAPTQGADQAKLPGMEHIENLVLGGQPRTAQAQPPGKSFTETMGAAFTAMGAAVSNFFKGLGDRIATIEMPQLPRISLRRQEAAQPNAASAAPSLSASQTSASARPYDHIPADVRATWQAMPMKDFLTAPDPGGVRLGAFREHVNSEFSPENFECFQAIQQFKAACPPAPTDGSPALPLSPALVAQARHIYDTFIPDGVETQVNLPSLMRTDATAAFSDTAPAGSVTSEVLNDTLDELVRLMQRDTFPRFQKLTEP